ncbi:hypothetical protein [Flavobacterium sp.]|uniref:hypothetical protein n=1 Tax=Flavobacterium sp. TaxID=239 RepID=UPI002486E74E|nr:hypothetical protein [Flavobacterium sp.]MDI1315963.1 hypothetical protein [Flavobacterium sp.]
MKTNTQTTNNLFTKITRLQRSCWPALFLLMFLLSANSSWGQSASATWNLTSNGNAAATGNISASSVVIGSGISTAVYNSTIGISTSSWSNDASNLVSDEYYQYNVSPNSGNSFNFTSLTGAHSRSSGNWKVAAYYSLNDFTNSTLIGSEISINSSTSTAFSFTNLNITVPSGSTLSIRIYAWESDGSNRSYQNRNIVISGTTCITNAGTLSGNQNICSNGTTTLGSTVSGGSWSSSNAGIAEINSSTGVVSGVAAGTATMTYTVTGTGGCSNATATRTVTVNPAPTSVTANTSVSVICSGGSVNLTSSATSNSATATTLLTQNFNGTPTGWTTTNTSANGTPTNAAWTLRTNGYNDGNETFNSNDASQFYLSNSDAQGTGGTTNTTLTSPAFSTLGMSAASLTFYHYYRHYDATGSAIVEISTDGTNWTTLNTYTTTQGTLNGFALVTTSLNSYINQGSVSIRYRYTAVYSWYWAIDNVTVTSTPSTPAISYAWTSTPSGYTSSTQNPTGVSPTVNTSYTVTTTNNYGCTATASTATVTVDPILVPSVTTSITTGTNPTCSGTSITFTAVPTNGGSPTYQWTKNGTNIPTATSVTYTGVAGTDFVNGDLIRVVMTSTATCASPSTATSTAINMTVNPILVPSVTTSITTGTNPTCSGTSITFTAVPTNGGSPTYQWTKNGTNIPTATSVTYTGVAGTDFVNGDLIRVVMTSTATCASPSTATSTAINMTVNPNLPASVSIAASPSLTICSGTNVTFTATPTNGGTPSYQWKLNGTNVGTNSATYSNASLTNGNTVAVVMTSTATCATGSPASSNTVTMTVNPNLPASVSIAASPSSTICSGTNVTFTASPTNGGTPSYQWKLNGGNVGTNSATYSNAALTNGNTVTVVMTSTATCATGSPATSNTVTMTVNPNLPASVSIAASPSSTICSGTNVTFTASPTNGGTPSYQWKLNGGNVGTNSATYSNAALTNGNTVTVVMTSTATCATGSPATSNTVTMTVNPNLPASVSIAASPSSTICSGTNVTFTATPTNGGTPSYQWKLNGINVGTNSATYSSAALTNGSTVAVVMTSTATCATGSPSTSNTVTMTVNPNLAASVSIAASPSSTICSGTNVTFTATPTNGGTPSYQWKLNGTNVGTNSATYSNAALTNGSTVAVVMTSTATCATGSPSTSNTVTMTVNPNLAASVSIAASPSSTICSGTNVTFTATPTNGGTPSYQWKLNGTNVGTNSATYSNAALTNGNTVAVVMTSTATCATGSPATSGAITITVNTPIGITSITAANNPIAPTQTTTITATGVVGTGALVSWYSGPNQTGTAYGTGLTSNAVGPGTYYAYVTGTCGSAIELATTISPLASWTGTINNLWHVTGNWAEGVLPTTATNVVIGDGKVVQISSADAVANTITINGSGTLTVQSGRTVTVTNAINTTSASQFVLESNANLLQGGTTNQNTGAITVKRNSSALMRLDYALWSSPVIGQGLYAFTPFTFGNRFYVYRTNNNVFNNADVGFSLTGLDANGVNGTDSSNVPFTQAKGYLIRMPWNHPTAPAIWDGNFKGVPNNGNIDYTLVDGGAGNRFNLVGNPYPSPINAVAFVENANNSSSITGAIYFWRKTNNSSVPTYCTWTMGGFVTNGGAQVFDPNDVIQTGQGFFVERKATGSGTINFDNTMRINNHANQIFRPGGTTSVNAIERNRIWLNATSASGAFSQTMVGYITNATQGVDPSIDGKYINDGDIALTSLINEVPYAIQGRALPFDTSDSIPLNFKATTAGNYTIAIDHVDGLFTGGAQPIYLKDNLTTTIHDLNTGAYTFAATAGTFASRFEIVYQSSTLGVTTPGFNENQVVIYKTPTSELSINTGSVIMSSVRIFDISGKLLLEKKGIDASQTLLRLNSTTEILLVQITSDQGVVVTKKVLFSRTSLKKDKKIDVKTQLAEDE